MRPKGWPVKLLIRGEWWAVQYLDKVGKRKKGRRCLGRTISWERVIQLDVSQAVTSLQTTLLHEIAHAMQYNCPTGTLNDEEFCDQFAGMIADLARNNSLSWLKHP